MPKNEENSLLMRKQRNSDAPKYNAMPLAIRELIDILIDVQFGVLAENVKNHAQKSGSKYD